MRKREVLSCCAFTILHGHTCICVDTFKRTYIILCMVMPTCTYVLYAHFVQTFYYFLFTARTHAREHSQWRRGVNAVDTWFPSLHTHSSLSRGPDRTLWPTGHGSTHTPTTHTVTLSHTHIQADGRSRRHQQYHQATKLPTGL